MLVSFTKHVVVLETTFACNFLVHFCIDVLLLLRILLLRCEYVLCVYVLFNVLLHQLDRIYPLLALPLVFAVNRQVEIFKKD